MSAPRDRINHLEAGPPLSYNEDLFLLEHY